MIEKIEKITNDIIFFDVKKTIIDKIYFYLVTTFLLGVMIPIIRLYLTRGTNYKFWFWICLIYLLFFMYIFIFNVINKHLKLSIDIIFLSIFLFVSIVSVFFSEKIYTSIVGSDGYYEGIVALLVYYLLYVNSKVSINKDTMYKYFDMMLIIGLIQSVYAFINSFTTIYTRYWDYMAMGACGNPNFFGTYTMLLSLLGIGLFIFYDKNKKFHLISGLILFMSLILASSTAPFIGFCFGFISLIIIFLIRKIKLDKLIIVGCMLVIIFPIVQYGLIYFNKNIYGIEVKDASTITGDIVSMSQFMINKLTGKNLKLTEIPDENIGSGRLGIWKDTIEVIKDNWLIGVGVDNLYLAEYRENLGLYITKKAHNYFLQVFVTSGIFAFVGYIAWFINLLVKSYKSKNKFLILYFSISVAYIVQGMFNISDVAVTPYFFIISGIMMGLIDNINRENTMLNDIK